MGGGRQSHCNSGLSRWACAARRRGMTVELALVATGAGSMLAAALAGSRRVARTARLGVVYVGLLCVVAGLALRGGATGSAAPVVSTTIAAQLAPDELSEEVRVFIDGRDVGRLRVDEHPD